MVNNKTWCTMQVLPRFEGNPMKMGGEESNETGRRKYNPSQVSAGIGRIRSMPAIAAVVLAFEACIGALLLGRSNLRFNFLVDNASRGTMMREGRHTAVDRDPAPHDNGKLHSIPRSLQELDERIVGGIPVDDGEYPFFVISAGMMLCGGTLIHPDIVLTAAHCGGIFSSGIFIGGTQLSAVGSTRIGVAFELPYPDYGSPYPDDNDLMLVKLSTPSSAPVVKLNFDPTVPIDMASVTVIGFGNTEEDGFFSKVLLETDIPVVPFTECSDYFGELTEDIMICAGGVTGRDSCQGDSGGPLLTSANVQVGIVSFGDGCAKPGVPGALYTRVSFYQEWIRSSICNISDNPPANCADSLTPTAAPVYQPTSAPVRKPTIAPTELPTGEPTIASTELSTQEPTGAPAATITSAPVVEPTIIPTTAIATGLPTTHPETTLTPTVSDATARPSQIIDMPSLVPIPKAPVVFPSRTRMPTPAPSTVSIGKGASNSNKGKTKKGKGKTTSKKLLKSKKKKKKKGKSMASSKKGKGSIRSSDESEPVTGIW